MGVFVVRRAWIAMAIGLVGALGAGASAAYGFSCTTAGTRCYINVRWTDRVVSYWVRTPAGARLTAPALQGAARRAFGRWNAVPCADLELVFRGPAGPDQPPGEVNEVVPVSAGWLEARRDPAAAALTVVSYGADTGRTVRARIEVNEEYHRFVNVDVDACQGAFDLEAVLTHEAGHFAGLAHPCEFQGTTVEPECPVLDCNALLATDRPPASAPTMWPVTAACDPSLRTLEPDDVAGLCAIYPVREAGRPCFNLPDQDQAYVSNQPFGCRTAGRGTFTLMVAAALIAGAYAISSSRRAPGDQSVRRSVRVSRKRASR